LRLSCAKSEEGHGETVARPPCDNAESIHGMGFVVLLEASSSFLAASLAQPIEMRVHSWNPSFTPCEPCSGVL
jgi:hypothetical protein